MYLNKGNHDISDMLYRRLKPLDFISWKGIYLRISNLFVFACEEIKAHKDERTLVWIKSGRRWHQDANLAPDTGL